MTTPGPWKNNNGLIEDSNGIPIATVSTTDPNYPSNARAIERIPTIKQKILELHRRRGDQEGVEGVLIDSLMEEIKYINEA